MNSDKKLLIIGITAPPSVDLIVGQLNYFQKNGFKVALLAPRHERVMDFCMQEGIGLIPIEIERNISPLKDFKTIIKLVQIFIRERPDIINLGTPKISLLGMIAGMLTRVPYRIYTCRGFRFEHETGWFQDMLINLEKVTASCAHKVFCISNSVKDLGVQMGIFSEKKSRLIRQGSSNGVDLSMFNPNNIDEEKLLELKNQLQLKDNFVFGFVGRLVDRKGLKEMYHAFSEAFEQDNTCRLLVVGRPFWDQVSDKQIISKLEEHPGVLMVGFQPLETVPYYLSLMDVFLLPAHWEGFGNVLIQAAAMGVAIVATEGTGVKDAVSKDYNGILVAPGDHQALLNAMLDMKENANKRNKLALNGITWSKSFEPKLIWKGYVDLYNEAL